MNAASESHETQWSDGTTTPRCNPPRIAQGTAPAQPDWTCAICGRVWRDMRTTLGTQWWAEIQGPTRYVVR